MASALSCNNNKNPFTNPLIINKIAEFSKFKELKSLREVNKSFRDLSTAFLKQKAWIHLNNKNLGLFLKFFSKGAEDDNNGFSNSTPATFICKRFYLSYLTIGFGKNENENFPAKPDINLFFTKLGQFIEEIVLEKCTFATYFWTLTSLFDFMPNCEYLSIGSPRVLEISAASNEEGLNLNKCFGLKYLEIVPDIKFNCLSITNWTSTFKMLPELKSLNLQCRNSTDISTVLSTLNSTIQNMNNFNEFSCFLTELKEEQLNLLIQLNIKFINLDLNLSSDISTQKLKELLNCSWNYLEILKLFHGILPTASDTTFPVVEFKQGFPYSVQLPNLKNLALIGDMVQSLDFLMLLPNLESLSILDHTSCQAEVEEEQEELIASDLVKNTFWLKKDEDIIKHVKLKYLSMEYSLQPICIEKLNIIIPNLKTLSLYFDNNSLRTVFKYLPGLEEIHVLGSEVTDEGITGIDMVDLLAEGLSVPYSNIIEETRALNYIGDCQHLKKFTLPPIPQPNISDFSVNYGFLDTRSLRTLELPMTSITDEGIKLLEENMHLVNFNCKYFVDDGEIFTRN